MARLDWKGGKLAAKVGAASVIGTDATMAACVGTAKAEHPWHNRTGFEEGSIQILPNAVGIAGAELKGSKVSGRWGALGGYSIYLEIGTSREDSGAPRAEERAAAAGGNMDAIAPPLPLDHPLMEGRPFLRPAADEHYRLHAMRVRQALRSLP